MKRFPKSEVQLGLLIASFLAVSYALYLVFLVVPNERIMGPVQRIFYFHVGSAFACYCAAAIVLISSLAYLANRGETADVILQAAGEVGFVFCSITLFTGMIWGYSAWNTPFQMEPRLVSTLFLWLIFLGICILRTFGDPEKVAAHSAVLGIVGAVSVPIVVFSVKFVSTLGQLHPQVIQNRGLRDPSFYEAFGLASLALILLQFLLVLLRSRIGLLERRVENKSA